MSDKIRKGRKFEQVLEGARDIFMKDGFEGASVDDIARAAEVSKATLYSYFPDKRLLFAEVARTECLRQADSAVGMMECCDAPEHTLRVAGERIAAFITSEIGRAITRLAASESHRFPELGQMFFESGPGLVHDRLVEYLNQAVAAGHLHIKDVDLAANQFAELCKAGYLSKILCGKDAEITEGEIDRTLTGAVDIFMSRYGR